MTDLGLRSSWRANSPRVRSHYGSPATIQPHPPMHCRLPKPTKPDHAKPPRPDRQQLPTATSQRSELAALRRGLRLTAVARNRRPSAPGDELAEHHRTLTAPRPDRGPIPNRPTGKIPEQPLPLHALAPFGLPRSPPPPRCGPFVGARSSRLEALEGLWCVLRLELDTHQRACARM